MKKINELKEERAQLIAEMEEITSAEELTEEQRSQFDELESKIETINKDIERAEKQETYNKLIVAQTSDTKKTEERKEFNLGVEFRDFLKDAVEGKRRTFILPPEAIYRADPVVTTTNTAIINKQVMDGVSVMQSPGEAFLRKLGVSFYEGLNGNFVVPTQAEALASFPGEDTAVSSAGLDPGSLTLAARRLGHSNMFSKEFLAQTNPGLYAGLVQVLVDGIWSAVVYDLFDQLETDVTDASTSQAGTSLAFGDCVSLEANVPYGLRKPAYVTTPAVASYLKQTAKLANQDAPWQGPINDGGFLNGLPAYGVSGANTNIVYYGDWSQAAIGTWGGIEILVDPYSEGSEGNIKLVAHLLVDTGAANSAAFSWIPDVSAAV